MPSNGGRKRKRNGEEGAGEEANRQKEKMDKEMNEMLEKKIWLDYD